MKPPVVSLSGVRLKQPIIRNKKASFLLLMIGVVLGLTTAFFMHDGAAADGESDDSDKGCTIFTVTNGEETFFAGSEDYRKEGQVIVGITPPTASDYGSVRLGFQKGESQSYEMAMNSQGLAWDVNSLPTASLNGHPEHPYSGWGAFLTTVTRKTSTVDEVIQLVDVFDLGDALEHCQLHVADSTGDAVVIGPGPDGEIAITRKALGDDYLVSTNFNRAIPSEANHPESYLRYDNTVVMLEDVSGAESLTPNYLGSILEASHFESLITYTLYSYVFDATHKVAYVYYLSDFDNIIRIDLADAFKEGQRWLPITDLVPKQVKNNAESRYAGVVARDAITIAILFFSAATLLGILITILTRFLRSCKTASHPKQRRLSLFFLVAMSFFCGSISILTFISHIYPPNIITLMRPGSLYNLSILLSALGFLALAGAVTMIVRHKRRGGDLRLNGPRGISLIHVLIGVPEILASGYVILEVTKLFSLF